MRIYSFSFLLRLIFQLNRIGKMSKILLLELFCIDCILKDFSSREADILLLLYINQKG